MNQNETNFQRLKKEFYFKTMAPRASRILRKKGSDMKYMRRLLRHHEEKAISNSETEKRDSFDNLLEYYSLLELALRAGFIQVPDNDMTQAISDLSHPALQVYYQEHYRNALPTLLLGRFEGKYLFVVPDPSGKLINIFLQYAPLAYLAKTDEDIGSFLWFLDGGRKGNAHYRDTLKVLRSRKRLLGSLTRRPGKKTAVDSSVEGFRKFLDFCVDLDATLRECSQFPDFGKMLFESHSYWFQQMGQKLKKEVFRALSNYVEVTEGIPENGYFAVAEDALNNLLSGRYALSAWPEVAQESPQNTTKPQSHSRPAGGKRRKITIKQRNPDRS